MEYCYQEGGIPLSCMECRSVDVEEEAGYTQLGFYLTTSGYLSVDVEGEAVEARRLVVRRYRPHFEHLCVCVCVCVRVCV